MNEILIALGRKGARGLDALAEALEDEAKANEEILKKIRAGKINASKWLAFNFMMLAYNVSVTMA